MNITLVEIRLIRRAMLYVNCECSLLIVLSSVQHLESLIFTRFLHSGMLQNGHNE